jgi:hypothetical protein
VLDIIVETLTIRRNVKIRASLGQRTVGAEVVDFVAGGEVGSPNRQKPLFLASILRVKETVG